MLRGGLSIQSSLGNSAADSVESTKDVRLGKLRLLNFEADKIGSKVVEHSLRLAHMIRRSYSHVFRSLMSVRARESKSRISCMERGSDIAGSFIVSATSAYRASLTSVKASKSIQCLGHRYFSCYACKKKFASPRAKKIQPS